MKTKDFTFTVSIKLNLEDIPKGVKLTKENVASMIDSALVNYTNDMAEEISACGDWNKDEQAIAASMPEFEVNFK